MDLASVFSLIPVGKGHLPTCSWQGQEYSFTVLLQGYVNSPAYIII